MKHPGNPKLKGRVPVGSAVNAADIRKCLVLDLWLTSDLLVFNKDLQNILQT